MNIVKMQIDIGSQSKVDYFVFKISEHFLKQDETLRQTIKPANLLSVMPSQNKSDSGLNS